MKDLEIEVKRYFDDMIAGLLWESIEQKLSQEDGIELAC